MLQVSFGSVVVDVESQPVQPPKSAVPFGVATRTNGVPVEACWVQSPDVTPPDLVQAIVLPGVLSATEPPPAPEVATVSVGFTVNDASTLLLAVSETLQVSLAIVVVE